MTLKNEFAHLQLDRGAVVTKALMSVALHLNLTSRALSNIIGISEPSVSRMNQKKYTLAPNSKSFEIAVLFIRMYRSLDSIVGGDNEVAKQWLNNPNAALGEKPIIKIQTVIGLVDVIAYLDARRAIV